MSVTRFHPRDGNISTQSRDQSEGESKMITSKVHDIAAKIEKMEIRGAGNIARAAAEGFKLTAEEAESREELIESVKKARALFLETRPSAISLINSIEIVAGDIERISEGKKLSELREVIVSRAQNFVEKSENATEKIGEIGSELISHEDTIVTHCHSSNFVSIVESAIESGKSFQVIVTETRPRYQGHRTVRELIEREVPATLIVDSAAGYFMKDADKFIVGASGIGRNGSVLSKIGTCPMACVANQADVPVIVAGETFKFYPEALDGDLAEIRERDPDEIIDPDELPKANIRNPPFDITPPENVDTIVTEQGEISPDEARRISNSLTSF